jgi:hypothetical protein
MMKIKPLFIVPLILSTIGCKGLDRLLGRDHSPSLVYQGPTADIEPDFNVPIIHGYQLNKLYGIVDSSFTLKLVSTSNDLIRVYYRLGNSWDELGEHIPQTMNPSYSYDQGRNIITFWHCPISSYVVYQWVKR